MREEVRCGGEMGERWSVRVRGQWWWRTLCGGGGGKGCVCGEGVRTLGEAGGGGGGEEGWSG